MIMPISSREALRATLDRARARGQRVAFHFERPRAAIPADWDAAYGHTLWACVQFGMWERAVALLNEMRMRGPAPDVRCHCAAISACARATPAPKWRYAVQLLRRMDSEVVRSSAELGSTVCLSAQ